MTGQNLHYAVAAMAILLTSGAAPVVAASLDGRLLGAWVSSGSDCKKVFVNKAGHSIFREPVDQFVRAFLIQPGRIVTSGGACRITSVAQAGDVSTVKADCHNTISYAHLTVRFTINSDAEMQYEPDGNPMLVSNYQKCGN